MSFSRAQQGPFRAMVEKAWQATGCTQTGKAVSAMRRAWYEAALEAATGQSSSVDCDAKRDFEDAMAHFEGLAGDGSFYWQMRKQQGDHRRIVHELGQLLEETGWTEEYLLGIAAQALGREEPPAWRQLTYDQLQIVQGAARKQQRRQAHRGDPTHRPTVEEPF